MTASANPITTILSDYGGVMTNPLAETIGQFAMSIATDPYTLIAAMRAVAQRDGIAPMAALEKGLITEAQFLHKISLEFEAITGVRVDLTGFRDKWFAGRRTNQPFVDYLAELRERGYPLAVLTNNVREWRPNWQQQLPMDIFDWVIDSSSLGVRKPEPEYFAIALERLGVPAESCLLIDDIDENCRAAAETGMRTVLFSNTTSAVAAIEKELAA